MAKLVRYGQMTFESNFLFGTDDQGSTVKFTRAERLLLAKFTQNERSVLTRDNLLDAMSGPGSDAADRNVDFVINRLRRKLRDSAREPVYIATQYGEGYAWIAERATQLIATAGAFLVVGPIRGLPYLGPFAELARSYVDELRRSLERQSASGRRVVLDEDCPPPDLFVGEKPLFAVELSFVNPDTRLDCAVTLKRFASGEIIRVFRITIAESGSSASSPGRKGVESTAGVITTAIWDALTYRDGAPPTPSDEPLAVRMHDAARLLTDRASWIETDRRTRSALEANPDDQRAKLMLATCLHTKYVCGTLFLPEHDFRKQDEDEMERLVLSSLPHLQNDPAFMMAAGKLLYFIDRGHRPLAIKIVEDAFKSTTAFATSFAILGQIRMLEGDFAVALSLYDQGLEQCQDGTEFQIYLLVLKCQALLASDQRKALDDTLEVLYAKKAETREHLSIFFVAANAKEITPEVQFVLDGLDDAHARGMLVYINYICARLFRFAEYRENILRGPLTLFVDRFGPRVVPDDLHASIPELVAVLTGGRYATERNGPSNSTGQAR
jgi:hypothetical protein